MSATGQRPNFLFLVGEDNGYHLGACGDPYAYTPNLDRLAKEGHFYPHMFSTAPVCAPSRCGFVTGRHAWSVGAHNMRSQVAEPPVLFTELLRDAGYYVSWPTKLDFNFTPPASFADDRDDWQVRLGRGELREPFLAYMNIGITHESGMWEKPFLGGGSAGARLSRAEELRDLPLPTADEITPPPYLPDHPEVRADLERFYQTLALHDRDIGAILTALAASPYADNTIIVYTADHGRGLAREKRWCYPAGIHVPLIMAGPPAMAHEADTDRVVSGVDLAPTMLALADVDRPESFEGVPILGPEAQPRTVAFAGRDRMDEAFDRVRAATDGRHLLLVNEFPQLAWAARNTYMERQATTQVIREMHAAGQLTGDAAVWVQDGKPPVELYDLEADPHAVRNLADDPAYADARQRLEAAFAAHQQAVPDLGLEAESDLEGRGFLVEGTLGRYVQRAAPLPRGQRIGPTPAPLTRHDVTR